MEDFTIKIPHSLFVSIQDLYEVAVFMSIYSFTNNGRGACYASQRAIAEKIGCDHRTVGRVAKRLVAKKLLKVSGRKKVFGGYVTVYSIGGAHSPTNTPKHSEGGAQLPTKPKKVGQRCQKVGQRVPQKAIKKGSKHIGGFKLPKKEPNFHYVSEDTWTQTLTCYQKALNRYRDKGETIKSPEALFETILKDEAEKLGDFHTHAKLLKPEELRQIVLNQDRSGETPGAYYQEAVRRGMI